MKMQLKYHLINLKSCGYDASFTERYKSVIADKTKKERQTTPIQKVTLVSLLQALH